MGKIAIITDIHANVEALKAVLEDISHQGIEDIISLGDNVGYGPDPVEVLRVLYDNDIQSLLGNHDLAVIDPLSFENASEVAFNAIEWTRAQLFEAAEKDAEFQNALDMYFGAPSNSALQDHSQVLLVHGSPGNAKVEYDYLLEPEDFIRPYQYMKRKKHKICFFGHTHRQALWEVDGAGVSFVDFDYGETVEYTKDELASLTLFINPGAVGQPRDQNPDAAYMIYESEKNQHSFTFKRVAYNIEKTAEKIYAIETLDDRLGDRLAIGA